MEIRKAILAGPDTLVFVAGRNKCAIEAYFAANNEIEMTLRSKGKIGIAGLVEKPKLEDASSNLASIGRDVLQTEIFDILRKIPPGLDKEIQLVDLTHTHAQKGSVEFVKLTGKQFDRGLVDGFMKVSIHDYSRRTDN